MIGIGIHGKKFSGKSEVAKILTSLFNEKNSEVKVLAFADKVKKISLRFLPYLNEDNFYNSSKKEKIIMTEYNENYEFIFKKEKNNKFKLSPLNLNKSARDIMKIVGEMGRSIHEDLWVWNVLNNMYFSYDLNNKINFIVDDVRRLNEFKALKDKEFLMIKVISDHISTNDTHPTESDLDHLQDSDFDFIIRNKMDDSLIGEVQKFFDLKIANKLSKPKIKKDPELEKALEILRKKNLKPKDFCDYDWIKR